MKKSLIFICLAAALTFGACNRDQKNCKDNNCQEQPKDRHDDGNSESDAKSDETGNNGHDGLSDNDGASDQNGDSGNDGKSDTEEDKPDDTIVCKGPAAYKDLPFIGKVQLGYPCNKDIDCAGEGSYCSENYSCESDTATFDYPNDISNLPDLYPCYDPEQCTSGICVNYEEDLNLCATLCKIGDKGDGNFSCVNDNNKPHCEKMIPSTMGEKCTHWLYDCGWEGSCNENGFCVSED